MNDISLTIRLPHEINLQLSATSKEVGMTKTNVIRMAIHDFLTDDKIKLDFSSDVFSKRDRIVLNVNQLTQSILADACRKYNQSMNAIVTAVAVLALERSSKWLQSTMN